MQSFFMQTMKTDQTVQMCMLIGVFIKHTSEDMFPHVAAHFLQIVSTGCNVEPFSGEKIFQSVE